MAVAFDAVASATGFTGTTTTLTFSHTCGASATLLIVGVSVGASPDSGISLGVTYNGTAMTALTSIKHSSTDATTSGFGQTFYLLSPTTGSAANVVVTRTGGSGTIDLLANAVSYSGAGTPTSATTLNGTLTALSAASKTVASGEMAGFFGSNGSSFGGATYSHTKRWDESVNGNSAAGNCTYQDTATTGTINFTVTPSATDWWNSHAFVIPAGGGGGGSTGPDAIAAHWTLQAPGRIAPSSRDFEPWPGVYTDPPPSPQSVTVDVATLTLTGVEVTPPAYFRYAASIDGTGRFILDQIGDPWPFWQTHEWNLIARAGEHNETGVGTTTPLSVFTGWAAKAQAQGFNAVEVLAISGATPGAHANGSTWDNVAPFTGGTIGSLNNTYWSRVDDLIDQCAAVGITVVLNVASSYAEASGGALAGLTTTNGTTYGTALGNRYKTKPNIIWQTGVDDFATFESQHQAIMDAIQATGDTHLITTQHMIESNTRTDNTGSTLGTHGQSTDITHDEVYSYNCAYLEVERDYGLSSPSVRPTLYANGHYDQTGTSGTFDWKLESDQMGWALTSGSKGMFFGSEATWAWESNAYGDYSNLTFANGPWLTTLTWFEGLTGWQKLIPDFGSLGFITSTRGTKATTATAPYSGSPANDYLTGAVTADGKLAVIYTPRHISTNTSRTITIDGTQMVASYTAKWVDPYTGAITTAASSATSYTTPGNNSNGQPNWYLLLQEATSSPITQAVDTATLTLTGQTPGASGSGASANAVDVATLTLTGIDPTGAGTGAASTATDVAALTLTGVDPAASGSGAVSTAVDVASLTLTGQDVAGTAGGAVADVATLTLTGVDPTASGTGAAAVVVDVATLTLTGIDPGVSGGPVSIAVDVASLTLTGIDPTGSGSGAAAQAADVATLTLTGVELTATGLTNVVVDTAALTLTAITPGAGTGTVAAVDTATLTLSGLDPTLVGSGVAAVTVDVVALVLSGVDPTAHGSGTAVVLVDPAVLNLVGVTPIGAPFIPDPNPITLTVRSNGRTATIRATSTRITIRENRNP